MLHLSEILNGGSFFIMNISGLWYVQPYYMTYAELSWSVEKKFAMYPATQESHNLCEYVIWLICDADLLQFFCLVGCLIHSVSLAE